MLDAAAILFFVFVEILACFGGFTTGCFTLAFPGLIVGPLMRGTLIFGRLAVGALTVGRLTAGAVTVGRSFARLMDDNYRYFLRGSVIRVTVFSK